VNHLVVLFTVGITGITGKDMGIVGGRGGSCDNKGILGSTREGMASLIGTEPKLRGNETNVNWYPPNSKLKAGMTKGIDGSWTSRTISGVCIPAQKE
jgi:hypothetical protein